MNMLKDIDGSWDKLQSLREGVGKRALLLVVRVCKHRHVRGRYFLVENPAGSLAWAFEGIMFRLIESCNANYVVSDQCAYGAIDLDSGKPIRKPTGWLSNSEPLLNALGRRCRCKWGAHQQVLGSNSKGARSRQAAAYPPDLCRAVCQGILHTMKLDYPSLVQQAFHLSYPVEGGDMDVDEVTVDADIEVVGEEPAGDVWEREQNKIVRKHLFPRKALFSPMSTETMPCDFRELLPQRTTFLQFEDGTTQTFEDCWTDVRDPFKTGQLFWKGRTEIAIQPLQEEDPPEPEGVVEAEPDGDANMVPAPETPAPATPGGPLRRKRPRTRQLQRGFWQEVSNTDVADLLQRTKEWLVERASNDWQILPLTEDLGRDWESVESAEAEIVLILVADKAKKLRKPQPHASPAEVPLRKSFLLLRNGSCLTTGWEELAQLAPSSQVRPLVAQQRELCVIVFGKPLGDIEQPVEADPRAQAKELQRAQKWASLPRELKLAIRRVHVNLGHASVTQMLRALRVSKASEVAIRACRLFRCEACPRVAPPKKQRPSKLPLTEEFNVQIGLDVFQCKDADGHNWSWLNILCQGTCFQIAVLLEQTHANPTSEEVIKAFDIGWVSWAGYPEFGVFTDRAKYFVTHFSEALSAEGVYFQSAAKASPWQIGQVERHGDIWKSMLKRVVWSEQVSGRESMVHATSAINQAKNSLIRRSGFSPAQWVLGRQTRLPADLTDESEVTRLGALSLSLTPTSRFYQKSKLRFAAREAFVKVSCSDALKRAELRKVKPSRGPFPVGSYVFYYDASDTAPGPECWRGVARVVGHEGSHTVWLSHRGLLIAVSPEHLAFAMDEEVQHWLNVGTETELMDAQPGAGGTGFIDLRALPKPKTTELDTVREGEEQLEIEDKPPGQIQDMSPSAKGDLEYEPSEAPVPEATEQALAPAPAEDMSSGSTSMARMRYESERDAKKHRRDSEFFARKERERREKRDARLQQLQQQAALTPLPPMETAEFDPEMHDYHQASPSKRLPAVSENPETEAQEREAKRLRGDLPPDDADGLFCYHVVEHPQLLKQRARESYANKIDDYSSRNVSLDDFLFAFRRNVFDEHYQAMYDHAMQATPGQSAGKKKGRKEVYLKDLPSEVRNQFLQPGGSDDREWQAWQEKEAVDVLSEAESQSIREKRPDLIIPTRWVRTNKNDGLEKAEFLAKSRLVVQGFKDRSLGFYRRDAPTASALAESVCLAVSAFKGFTMISKDVKNAYFSGKSLDREIYLEQPRGGLRGLKPKQLLKAKKAIYGFSEAARMFWIALKGHLNSDGWEESRLEPALFYLRDGGADGKQLRGILVTHVDDVEGGIIPLTWTLLLQDLPKL